MDYVGILVAANLALGFEGFVVTGSPRGRKIATRVAVVGGNAQLPPRFNAVDIGDRYMEATNYFGGVIVDICSEDWSPGVADASNQVEPFEEWQLSHNPVPETIRVFIDGQLNWDWSYDDVGNKVIFTVTPPAGSLVEIGYIISPDQPDDGDTGDTGP